jgi:hypothetical protein
MREAAAASPTPRRSAIQYGARGILRSALEATPYSVLSTVAASENTAWRISVRCSNPWYRAHNVRLRYATGVVS